MTVTRSITSYNEADKTHHGVGSISEGHEDVCHALQRALSCPVTHIVFKQAKLQRPLRNIDQSCNVWYYKTPMGHNTLGCTCMMSTIFKASGLSRNYTNQCVRATTATVLAHAGVSSVGITCMSFTGQH